MEGNGGAQQIYRGGEEGCLWFTRFGSLGGKRNLSVSRNGHYFSSRVHPTSTIVGAKIKGLELARGEEFP
jgi:hypothetical protein